MKSPKNKKIATCFHCNEYALFGVFRNRPYAICPKCLDCMDWETELMILKQHNPKSNG